MNGPYQSVYGVVDHTSPRLEEKKTSPVPAPPKAAPRSTVFRPVTVGTLREAKAAQTTTQRVPITQRVKEPEVPAREKVKKKTVAFGATVNVSQTVEREKDPHPIHRLPRPVSRIPPSTKTTMSLGRVGVGAERPPYGTAATRTLAAAARQPTAAAAAAPSPSIPVGDENRPPRGESMREEKKESIAHLETRIAELEKRERQQGEKHAELQMQFDRVVKIVTTLTQRVAELEVELGGNERRRGGGERRERSSEEDEGSRSRRRLYSPEEGGKRGEGRKEQRQGRETRDGGGGLLGDHDAIRALERQLSSNPLLRRHVDDAIAQDKYDRDYGGEYGRGERRTTSPQMRRGGAYGDEYDDEPRGANGRCPGSAPTQRWKEDTRNRPRLTSPRGGVTKKRADITPSRRRVTERVTMERVHHYDDTDEESDGGGGYGRYDSDERPQPHPRTLYSEEIVDDIHSAVIPKNGGRGGYGQPPRRNQQQAGPFVTEVSDSEDDLERKRRQLRERLEARGGRK